MTVRATRGRALGITQVEAKPADARRAVPTHSEAPGVRQALPGAVNDECGQ